MALFGRSLHFSSKPRPFFLNYVHTLSVEPVLSNTTFFRAKITEADGVLYQKNRIFLFKKYWLGIFKHLHNIRILLSRLLTIHKDAFKEMRPGSFCMKACFDKTNFHVYQPGAIKSVRTKLSFWK